ncbi:hypothetical protein GCK72_021076 [Caenorhabditis remanei]|uniref:Uncharacterized protein n=1 Tax=Caenorhabditis remanei TaxID=31234 RepID=A0A6A5GIK7_CAERE|nr:hypothetical protein GCK72_021076 [Caenorhabditis remanei]KAF1754513.1 hypothetical protein GCK72_021076 [Caenorhabditis remanei]
MKDSTGSPMAKRSKQDDSSSMDRTLKMRDGPFYKTFSVFNPKMAITSRRIRSSTRFIHHSATPNAVLIEILSQEIPYHSTYGCISFKRHLVKG